MDFNFARDCARVWSRSIGKWLIATTAIGLSTLPAACGGGGDSGGTTPPPPAGTAPTITVQPQSQTVVTGDKATFSITATGSATLSYQWSRNGTPISGQTSATYTTPATTLQDTGSSFTVVVSNSSGQITSNAASLTANANPEGIYTGAFTASAGLTLPVVAIILKDGTAEVFATQQQVTGGVLLGFALRGLTVKPNGTHFSSSFTGVTQAGVQFSNAQSTLPGTLTGNVTSGQSITGTFTTSLDTGTFALTAQTADYARTASGATIAGTYIYQSAVGTGSGGIGIFNSTTTYAADGTGTGANDQGCNGSVAYSIPDATHNAYKVSTSSVCPTGPVSYSGLIAYFPADTGASVNTGVNFTRDTFLAIVENQTTSYVVIASK